MPLTTGSSNKVISHNIAELINAGHKPSQAAAIAYKEAGRAKTTKAKGSFLCKRCKANINTASVITKSENGQEKPKTAPPSDRFVQNILSRTASLASNMISSPISLDDGNWLSLMNETVDESQHSVVFSGVVYVATEETKMNPTQNKPIFAFRGLTIPELVWYLYDRHIIHEKSEEQMMRDDKIVEIKNKLSELLGL